MKSRLEPHFDIAPTNKSLGSPQSDGGSEGNSIERQWSPDSLTCLCCWVPRVGLLDSSLTQAAWAALIVDFRVYICIYIDEWSADDNFIPILDGPNSTMVRGFAKDGKFKEQQVRSWIHHGLLWNPQEDRHRGGGHCQALAGALGQLPRSYEIVQMVRRCYSRSWCTWIMTALSWFFQEMWAEFS